VGKARGRYLNAPLGCTPRCVELRELLRERELLGPCGRWHVGIKTGVLKQILIPVQDDAGALKGNTPGYAGRLADEHEGWEEALKPSRVVVRPNEIVDGCDRLLVDQREHVGREQQRGRRWIAALVRGQGLDDRFLIATGIDRLHLDAGVILF